MTTRKRGRPVDVPAEVIISARAALARGEHVATVARAYGLSPRYVRDLRAGTRRPEAVEVPAALEAVPGEYGDDLREIYRALKIAEIRRAR